MAMKGTKRKVRSPVDQHIKDNVLMRPTAKITLCPQQCVRWHWNQASIIDCVYSGEWRIEHQFKEEQFQLHCSYCVAHSQRAPSTRAGGSCSRRRWRGSCVGGRTPLGCQGSAPPVSDSYMIREGELHSCGGEVAR